MNPNSIILNNMNSGVYPNGYIPAANPMGNIVGIGNTGYNNQGQGYMGGYYTNNYNNYYNPYLAQQQYEIQQAQQREVLRQQSDLIKNISRAVNKSLNKNVDDDYLKRYDPENYYKNTSQGSYCNQQYDPDYFDHNQLLKMYHEQPDGNMLNMNYINNVNQVYEQEKNRIPDECGLADYHKYASDILYEIEDFEIRKTQRNLTRLYNNQQYRQLIDSRSGANNYFNSMFNGAPSTASNINIDDMSVKLPHHLVNNNIEERRKAFFNTITSGR